MTDLEGDLQRAVESFEGLQHVRAVPDDIG